MQEVSLASRVLENVVRDADGASNLAEFRGVGARDALESIVGNRTVVTGPPPRNRPA